MDAMAGRGDAQKEWIWRGGRRRGSHSGNFAPHACNPRSVRLTALIAATVAALAAAPSSIVVRSSTTRLPATGATARLDASRPSSRANHSFRLVALNDEILASRISWALQYGAVRGINDKLWRAMRCAHCLAITTG